LNQKYGIVIAETHISACSALKPPVLKEYLKELFPI